MIINVGDVVIYGGEEYVVFFTYSSGYIEIKQGKHVILVHASEVTKKDARK